MEQRLNTVAEGGDINGLYECIREDPGILDYIDNKPFVDTPLHIAAAAGSTDFALEMMNLKPSFGMKLNPDGLSPLHLALRNRHFETVKQLISFDKELIRVKGRQMYTALHYAALRNEFDCLAEFLCACPAAIEERTAQGETALHIAVKRLNSEASKVLLGWMRKTRRRKILNWTDNEGNTVLHIAAFTLQPQIVKSILDQNYINRNAVNFEGLTARDLAIELDESEARREILDMLFPEFLRGLNMSITYSLADFLKDDVSGAILEWSFRVRSGLSLEDPFPSLVRLVMSAMEVIDEWIARLGQSMKFAIYKCPLIGYLLVIWMIPVAIKTFITIRVHDDNEVASQIMFFMIFLLFNRGIAILFFLGIILKISNDYISTSFPDRDIIDNLPLYALWAWVFGFFFSSYWIELMDLSSFTLKRHRMRQRLFDELN